MVPDDRFDRRQELGRGHDGRRRPRAGEHRFDHLGVAVVRDDHAVLHGVSADDAAGGHPEAEHRIARRRELMGQLLGRRPAIPGAGIRVLEDHHATALDARVARIHGGGDEVRRSHVRDEASALVDLQQGLVSILPLGDAHAAAQHAGVDADIGNRLGEGERSAPDLAVLARLRRDGARHVGLLLLGGAPLVDGRQRQRVGHARCSRAGVDPGQLVRNQSHHEVLRPFDVSAVFGIDRRGGDPRGIELLEQRRLVLGPLVRVPGALGDRTRNRATGHGPRGLDDHLVVKPVGKSPHDLPNVVAGQRFQLRRIFCWRGLLIRHAASRVVYRWFRMRQERCGRCTWRASRLHPWRHQREKGRARLPRRWHKAQLPP